MIKGLLKKWNWRYIRFRKGQVSMYNEIPNMSRHGLMKINTEKKPENSKTLESNSAFISYQQIHKAKMSTDSKWKMFYWVKIQWKMTNTNEKKHQTGHASIFMGWLFIHKHEWNAMKWQLTRSYCNHSGGKESIPNILVD